jgi:hypothetical protein
LFSTSRTVTSGYTWSGDVLFYMYPNGSSLIECPETWFHIFNRRNQYMMKSTIPTSFGYVIPEDKEYPDAPEAPNFVNQFECKFSSFHLCSCNSSEHFFIGTGTNDFSTFLSVDAGYSCPSNFLNAISHAVFHYSQHLILENGLAERRRSIHIPGLSHLLAGNELQRFLVPACWTRLITLNWLWTWSVWIPSRANYFKSKAIRPTSNFRSQTHRTRQYRKKSWVSWLSKRCMNGTSQRLFSISAELGGQDLVLRFGTRSVDFLALLYACSLRRRWVISNMLLKVWQRYVRPSWKR